MAGWPDARALIGGWAEWQAARLPVEKRPVGELESLTTAR